MKHTLLSLSAILALSKGLFAEEANSFSEIFSQSRVGGEFRTIYQHNSNIDHLDSTRGSSDTGVIGGKVELATRTYKGFDAVVTGYGTTNIGGNRNQTDGDYLNNGKENSNYALLGQAFLRYTNGDSFVQAGRFELDTPLMNSDDIRMVPDLYQGIYGALFPIEDLRFEAGYIDRMAGWENGGDNAHFTKIGTLIDAMGILDNYLTGKSAVSFAGISYGNEEAPFSIRLFDYETKNIMNQLYSDAQVNVGMVTLQGQYLRSLGDDKLKKFVNANALSNVMIDSVVYGMSVGIKSEETNLELNLAFNRSIDKNTALFNGGTPDFFGGANDPFYTSMDVLTIHQMGNAKGYKAEISYEPSDELAFGVAHAVFKKEEGFINHESDFSMIYGINENISLEGMISKVVETNDIGEHTTNNRTRLMVRVGF